MTFKNWFTVPANGHKLFGYSKIFTKYLKIIYFIVLLESAQSVPLKFTNKFVHAFTCISVASIPLVLSHNATEKLSVVSTGVMLDKVPQCLLVFLQEALLDLNHVNLKEHRCNFLYFTGITKRYNQNRKFICTIQGFQPHLALAEDMTTNYSLSASVSAHLYFR